MNALERLDNGTIDSKKELPKGLKPLGFHVGQGGGNVGEKGHTHAGSILDPRHSNAKKLAGLFGALPVS
jgi:hypothetical protein